MSDFVQTMKDWRRMCKDRRCDICRLEVNGICNTDPESRTDEDIWKIEKTINEWAAEHPEPVYPTWVEWLVNKGVLLDVMPVPTLTVNAWYGGVNAQKRIPADIAQKLGLKPKEG